MLLMGDEARRSQRGNNNPYCQNNETTWFDWNSIEKQPGLHRFVSLLLARRALRKIGDEQKRLSLNQLLRAARKAWHGTKLNQPDWSPQSHSLALSANLRSENLSIYIILNAYWEPLEFELPVETPWRLWIDTSLESPRDIVDWPDTPAIRDKTYRVQSRSVVVLVADSK